MKKLDSLKDIHPLLLPTTTDQQHKTQTTTRQTTITKITNNSTNTNTEPDQNHALLFQKLRAQAHQLGLETESLGWSIIQSIHNPIQQNLTTDTAFTSFIDSLPNHHLLLILPNTKLTTNLTPEIIFNHILITSQPNLEEPNPSEHYLCNLNGWKALMEGDRILFTSPGSPLAIRQINNIDFRTNLSNLKPSTSISNELTSPARLRFPIYHLLSPPFQTITIPRLSSSQPARGSAAQRLASLFSSKQDSEPLTIYVRVCERAIDSFELDQAICRAVSSRISDGLGSLEEHMLSIIHRFLARFSVYGLPSTTSSGSPAYTQGTSLHLASNEEIAQVIQEMYGEIDEELKKEYQQEIGAAGNGDGDEKMMIIDHTLELVEEVVCVELYDRLFEDLELDTVLSEKIAQLNLLDITLDHLGLDLDRREMDDPETIITIRAGLDGIIKAASVELSRLQDPECCSPRDKVGVYVTVHKLIVDRLSLLPPIPMKKEGIPTSLPSGKSFQDEENSNEVEMSHTFDRTTTVADSLTMDRTLPMPTPLRPVDKNQASASDLMDAIHTSLIDPPAAPSSTDDVDVGRRTPDPPPSKTSNRPRPNSSSADLILPILIYLIIKANPKRLESNLNYVNRFRYQRLIKGETAYCLVNFSVSCQFIKSFQGLDGSDLVQLPASSAHQSVGRSSQTSLQRPPGSSTVYGTFTSNHLRANKEKNGNMNEVEDALIAASRAVGGVLMEGYQKVISSTLLDAPVAKFGLNHGPRSGPRTLEDVKKLIGSGSAPRHPEGNMSSWSDRVGLLGRNLTTERPSPPQPSTLDGEGGGSHPSHRSNAVKRISSLFHNNSPAPPAGSLPSSSHSLLPPDDDRVTIGQRLSSLPGLGRLAPRSTKEIAVENPLEAGSQTDDNADPIDPLARPVSSGGPIERLERCPISDNLLVSDIPILLADYQRLARVGRLAGLWS